MGSAWVTIVKKNCQTVSDQRIKRHCCIEQLLLDFTRQFGPEQKGCMTQQSLELADSVVHFFLIHHEYVPQTRTLPVQPNGCAAIKVKGCWVNTERIEC
jgi:hypothetical protein